MALNTRRPTGAVPWPLILIEGPEKCGKSWACAELSASDRIGRTLWLDLGEGAADEYGAVPGADFEIIEHAGTWASVMGQVVAAKEEALRARDAGEKPVALVIDSMTAEWDGLKDWASARAARSDSNKMRRQADPDCEIKVSQNLWNDATARHKQLMTILMTFPGIVMVTAGGKLVTGTDDNGRPVEGSREYKVEGHKRLGFDCSAWVRLSRDAKPLLIGARSVHSGIRPGIDKPKSLPQFTPEWLIFDYLKCDPAKAHVRDLVHPKSERTPEEIRDEALQTTTTPERITELYAEARGGRCGDVELENEHGDTETLAVLLYRVKCEREGRPAGGSRTRRPVAAVPAGDQRDSAQDGAGNAAEDDTEWIRDWSARVAGAADEQAVGALAREIPGVVRAGRLTHATANELNGDAAKRRRDLRGGSKASAA